jgi:hypothetical protein
MAGSFLAGVSLGRPAGLALGVLGCPSFPASLFGGHGLDALAAAATACGHGVNMYPPLGGASA